MENLNINEKDIIKYKKLSHFRITSIVFTIIALITYSTFKMPQFYTNPIILGIVLLILFAIREIATSLSALAMTIHKLV